MSGVLLAARARRRLKQFGRISAPLGFLITATSLIILNTAIAAGNPFKVTNAEITDRSTGVEASIGSFTDTKISSDVTFYQLRDSVSYAVTLANTGSQDILINAITDDNENSYISYIYNNHAGTELAAGDSLTLDIVAKYSTEIPDITARSQHLEVKFMIDYDEIEEEIDVPATADDTPASETTDETSIPDTGANTHKKAEKHATVDPAVIVFLIIGIVLLIAGLTKSKISLHAKALVLILLGTITSTSMIKATSGQVAFEFVSDIDIKSLLSITYTVDGEEKTATINYGDTLPITNPDKPGYTFDGWVDENGDPFDPNSPITDDIQITPVFTADDDTEYTVYHELENLAKTAFVLDKTETFQGTTDTEVTPETINYEGFIVPEKQTIVIKGDGTASVTYQYIRDTFDITIDPTDVIITPANPETCALGEDPDECDPNAPINPVNPDDPSAPVDPIDPDDPLPYGTKIVLTAKDVEHYTFDHWSSSDSAINNKTNNPLVIIVTGPVDAVPVYTGNPYTVTFNAESTEVSGTPTQASITTTYPALIGELPTVTNMTKIGYNFLGWYFEDGTTKLTSSFQPTENVTVYAHYEHVDTNFTINHRWPESPDSTTMVNHEVEYVNCLIGDPILTSTHIKDYSPRAVVNAASAATNPTCLEGGSYNLDYDWMLYELSFASDEYKGVASTTGNFPMDKQVTIAAATRNNYTFDHWESSYSNIDNIQNSTYSFTMPAEDITDVTPIYRARVTFNPGDSAEVVETHRDIIEGDVLGTLPNIINLDYRYEFDGWYTAATGGDEVTEDYVPAGNTTIFAHYTRKTAEYAVYHYVCDPDNITCDTIAHEDYDTANVGDEVTPDFYNFSSEYGNGLNNPSAKTTITIYENTPNIVEYIYTRKYFTLTYDNSSCVANNGNCISGSSTAAGQIAYGDGVSIEAEEVEHYRFDRWIITGVDNVDTQSESANFEMPDGDVVVKPTYLGLDYSVVFEQSRPGEEVYGYINGNNYINTVYPNAIGALPTISNINDENYDFVGWFLDDADGSQLTTSYVPHEETPVVAYAHYEQKRAQYIVKHYKMTTEGEYEVDPDDTDGPLTANVGASVTPEVKQYDGFTAPATRAIAINADSEQNVVEYYYARKQTTVVFNKNNAAATGTTASQQARYGETITLNENGFALTGYTFAGWATSADGNVAYDDQDDFVGTIEGGEYELFAKWTPNTFTVVFHANSDEVSNPTAMTDQVVTYDETTTLTPNVYEREHYKLMGWATSENGAKVYNDGADITNVISENNGELNLYAVWRERIAMLNTGSNVNAALKAVNADATTFTHYTGTPEIDAIENKRDIALATSNFPVYVWDDNGTIYWWSEAENVYMNADSGSVFKGTNFVSIDASGFDASTATNMQLMFIDTRNVENINISGWDTSNVTSMYAMFNRAGVNKENPVNVDLTELDVENVQSFNQMFKETKFVSMDLSSWNVESVTNTTSMFSSMPNLTTLNISGFDLSGLGDTPIRLFQSNNPSVISNSLLTSPETITMDDVIFNKNMDSLFENQSKLTTLSINNIDTSRTTSMQSMFNGARNLAALDATQFNTANVTNMYRMFVNANTIASLDVSGWDVSKVTNMDHLFDMANLTSIDLSTWNTQSLAVITGLFDYARNLETIYVGENFNITNATVQNSSMFRENAKLVGGAGTAFNGQMTNSGKTHGRIDEPCDDRPGLFTLKNSQYICFYANDGSSTTAGQYIPANTSTALRANTFTRDEYDLVGWNTAADGTGELTFEDAESIMVSSEYISEHFKTPIKLYAQWKRKSHTITFHPNMDGVTGEMATQSATHGTSPWLRTNTYTKDHWRFLGWTTEPSENIIGDGDLTAIDYANNATIRNVTTDIDLYAKWVYRCRTFTADSWDTIISKVEADQNYYDAGDFCEKEIEMDVDDDNVMETYTIRLANTTSPAVCSTAGYSQTACGIVIEFANVIKPVTMNATTVGGWKESQVAAWLNSEFYDKLPSELKDIIIPTYPIVSGPAYQGYSDDITEEDFNINKIYLFTGYEAGGKEGATNWDIKDDPRTDTRILDHYTGLSYEEYSDSRIKRDLEGNAQEWWLRNACNYSTSYFGYMGTRGRYGCGNAVFERWLAPAFRIGRKLTVSFNAGEGGVASEATRDYATAAASYGTLPTITTLPEDSVFLGWYTAAVGGNKIENASGLISTTSHTLYAHYRDISAEFAKYKFDGFKDALTAFEADGAIIENIIPGDHYPEEWYLTGCGDATNCYEMQADDSPYKVVAWYDENNSENKNLYYAAEYDKYILNSTGSATMFSHQTSLVYVNLSKFDGRETINYGYMFEGDTALKTVVLGDRFNSDNVTTFEYMFNSCSSLESVDLENISTASATNLSHAFHRTKLTTADVEKIAAWDVSKVTNFDYVFAYMENLTNVDLSGWTIANTVWSYDQMFSGDSNLVYADISSLKTTATTDIASMFQNCTQLETVIASTDFDGSIVSIAAYKTFTFASNIKLTGMNGTKYRQPNYEGNFARIDDPAHDRPGYFTLANPLVVTFDAGEGTASRESYNYIPSTDYGTLPIVSNIPEGKVFDGWYTAAEGGEKVEDNSAFVSNEAHTLYARFSLRFMQDMTIDALDALIPNNGDTITLYDNRDNKAYTVGRLADGNVWLLENLRLDPTEVALDTLKGNTNASDTSLEYLKGVRTGTADDQYAMAAVSSTWPTGADNYAKPFVNTSRTDTVISDGYEGKAGVYYNYCAATAGSYCYGDGSDVSDVTTAPESAYGTAVGDAWEDICPAGWRLPTASDTGEYKALYGSYSEHSDLKNAFRAAFSSTVREGVLSGTPDAYYWAPNQGSTSGVMATSTIFNNTAWNYSYIGRQYGLSVRCIFNKNYMQSTPESLLGFLMPNDGDTTTLYDKRDGKAYEVANINGTYWMADNLDLAGGTVLTSALSNVETNYTLPSSSIDGFKPASYTGVYNSNNTECAEGTPCYSYYDYNVATAGTNPSSGDATSDICPAGWRLPTVGEYNSLASTYPKGTDLVASPFAEVYAGYFEEGSGTFWHGGVHGYIYSSTAVSANDARYLSVHDPQTYTSYTDKLNGRSVRCVAKTTTPATPIVTFDDAYSAAGKTKVNNYYTMQDMDSSICNAVTTPVNTDNSDAMTTQLLDTRNNKVYGVGKLVDGRCWLLDNLSLDLTDADVQDNLTEDTTNASNTTLGYLKNGGGGGADQYAMSGAAIWTTSYNYSIPYIITAYSDTTGSGGYEAGKYGVYYTYCAATAGSYCYGGSPNYYNYGNASGDATEDICPKGWRLPTGGNSGETNTVSLAYDSDRTSVINALHAPFAGDAVYGYDNSSGQQKINLYYQGTAAHFWSSTFGDSDYMHSFAISETELIPSSSHYRTDATSVRCIAK